MRVWRWVMRLGGVTVLASAAKLWVVGYFGMLSVNAAFGERAWSIDSYQGLVFMYVDGHLHFPSSGPEFGFQEGHWDPYYFGDLTWGFHCGPIPAWDPSYLISFPLWLPTLAMGMLCWLVWRRTPPKSSAKGFPVEMKNNTT